MRPSTRSMALFLSPILIHGAGGGLLGIIDTAVTGFYQDDPVWASGTGSRPHQGFLKPRG